MQRKLRTGTCRFFPVDEERKQNIPCLLLCT